VTALLALALALAGAAAERFWERDLGGVARAVHLAQPSDERAFFSELTALVTCRELPGEPLPQPAPGRSCASSRPAGAGWAPRRLTATRSGATRSSPVLPHGGQSPASTGRAARLAGGGERWSDELELIADPVAACGQEPPGHELALLGADVVAAWAHAPEVAARLGYHRAALLAEAGRETDARSEAARLDVRKRCRASSKAQAACCGWPRAQTPSRAGSSGTAERPCRWLPARALLAALGAFGQLRRRASR